jgi:hypothetical protein
LLQGRTEPHPWWGSSLADRDRPKRPGGRSWLGTHALMPLTSNNREEQTEETNYGHQDIPKQIRHEATD